MFNRSAERNFKEFKGTTIFVTKYEDVKVEKLLDIINKLEDYSKEIKSQYITDISRRQYEGEKVCFEDILDRLQELKGSDSNVKD